MNPTYLKISNQLSVVGKTKPFFQPKLAINQPNDIYEQEADAVADKVMRMHEPSAEKKFFSPSIVQRKCADSKAEEKNKIQHRPGALTIQRQETAEEVPDPVGEGLSTVAENLGENNPEFTQVTEELADRFLSQPAALSVGLPVFLGANYAFIWGLAIANPSMRRHMNDFNLAMIPGIIPQFPIKTFTYRILDPEQTRFGFEFGLDASGLIDVFNEGAFNTHISTLSFDTEGNLATKSPSGPSLGLSSLQVNLGLFDDGLMLSGGFRQGIDPYPLFERNALTGDTSRIMQQVPGLPDLYPGQQDVRFMLQVDFVRLYNHFNPSTQPIRTTPQQVEGDRVDRKIQRKCSDCEEEEKRMQRKASNDETAEASSQTEKYLSSLSGGKALSPGEKNFFGQRMGYDFSNVRLHTDSSADESAKNINALAYTQGNNIVFRAGQYQAETDAGKRLLAHELTHVVQQGSDMNKVQRKITIGGNTMRIDKDYLDKVDKTFGPAAVVIVEKMDNKGSPPDFPFATWNSFRAELRIRTNAIKGMELVHAGCCEYPSTEPDGYVDPVYWDRNGWMDFSVKTPLASGKDSSDAIEAIFKSGAGTQLECLTMTVAIEYYSLLRGLGKEKFNKMFPAGKGVIISTPGGSRASERVHKTAKYSNLTLDKKDLLPGDWVYFKNFSDYTLKHPGGFWQGENAIVMGDGIYRGFGVSNKTETELNSELVSQYNTGLPAGDQKTLADLLREGGGLKRSPVFRPNISEIVK